MSTSSLSADWSAGTPFAPPVPVSIHPLLAFLTLFYGLFFAARYGITQNSSVGSELVLSIVSSISLGFGIVFLFLSVGLYV